MLSSKCSKLRSTFASKHCLILSHLREISKSEWFWWMNCCWWVLVIVAKFLLFIFGYSKLVLSLVCFAAASAGLIGPAYSPYAAPYAAPYASPYAYSHYAAPAVVSHAVAAPVAYHAPVVKAGLFSKTIEKKWKSIQTSPRTSHSNKNYSSQNLFEKVFNVLFCTVFNGKNTEN